MLPSNFFLSLLTIRVAQCVSFSGFTLNLIFYNFYFSSQTGSQEALFPLYNNPPYSQPDVSDEEFRRINNLCPYDCTCDSCKPVVADTPRKYTESTRGLARLYYLKYKKIPQTREDLSCLEAMFKSSDEEEGESAANVAAAQAVAEAAVQALPSPPPPPPPPTIDDPEYEWSSDSELAAFMFPLGAPLVHPSQDSDSDSDEEDPIIYQQL